MTYESNLNALFFLDTHTLRKEKRPGGEARRILCATESLLALMCCPRLTGLLLSGQRMVDSDWPGQPSRKFLALQSFLQKYDSPTRLVKTQCTGSSGSRPQFQRPIGFSIQMRPTIGRIKSCQLLLLMRRKHPSFSLNRNVERVNRPSGALREGGAFLARTSTWEKSAPTGPPFPSASRRTDRHRAPMRHVGKPPYSSHCGRPTHSHPSRLDAGEDGVRWKLGRGGRWGGHRRLRPMCALGRREE